MIPLQSLVEAVQAAVIEAADQVRLKNISILQDYFIPAIPSEAGLPEGPLVPRMIQIDFPRVTENGPTVHTVQVPLISIAPPESLYLAEFRVRMKVEFDLDPEKATRLRVTPARPEKSRTAPEADSDGKTSPEPAREFAEIEILIKHGQEPGGLTDVIQGYDRALRAEIPG